MRRLTHVRKDLSAIGRGTWECLDVDRSDEVLAIRFDSDDQTVIAVGNLSRAPVRVDIAGLGGLPNLVEVFSDADYDELGPYGTELELEDSGFRWFVAGAQRP